MKCKNHHVIRGYVGKDPVVKNLPGGGIAADFSVATTSKWKDKKSGEWQEQTEWHNVKAWRYLAERVERDLKKGSYVEVEGKSVTETWPDKDGKTCYKTVINASDVDLLEKRQRTDLDPKTDSDRGGDKGW